MVKQVLIGSMVFAGLCAAASAQTGLGQFSAPKKDGTETVSYTYKDKDGHTQTGSVTVDLKASVAPAGETKDEKEARLKQAAADKAAAIAAKLNAEPALTATSVANVVTVTADGDNKLRTFKVTNNTSENKNSTEILSAAPTMAMVGFSGTLIGTDTAGLPAEVEVGTNNGSTVVQTADFSDIQSMVATIIDKLASAGILAQPVGENGLSFELAPDEALVYGCDDAGLVQDASVAIIEEESGAGDDATGGD